jgi:hypothetical protein
MRHITQHMTNAANEELEIRVVDEPGVGGANHLYRISGYRLNTNPSHVSSMFDPTMPQLDIYFQNGPIQEVGVNGVTHEALLAILIDRLKGFQTGAYACKANAQALDCLEQAMTHLHARTLERQARNVEGTHGL